MSFNATIKLKLQKINTNMYKTETITYKYSKYFAY
jgi:hypothetical protein